MSGGAVIILILALVSSGVAFAVYRKRVNAGKSPWGWTIASFLISALVVVLAIYGLIAFAYSFGR
jgi:hypothetical protein